MNKELLKLVPNSADLSVETMQLMPSADELPLAIATLRLDVALLSTEVQQLRETIKRIIDVLEQQGVI